MTSRFGPGPAWCLATTAPAPGAIAVIQLTGDVGGVLGAITGTERWPVGRMRLVNLAGVDRGLAARVAEDVAELMPHGGVRVVQRLLQRLEETGVPAADPGRVDPRVLYPEAAGEIEALMLGALSRAASPLACPLLLDQPRRWCLAPPPRERAALDRSRRLGRLIVPPWVVVAGRPNAGKSTLSNALLGRSMSIALPEPGTTRDYTAGLIDLAGLVVRWHDTPGLRRTTDPVEREAQAVSAGLLRGADCLLALAGPDQDWPSLPRDPDLRVASKADLGIRADADLWVSAASGRGLEGLAAAVRRRLVPDEDLAHPGPWRFDERLPG